LVVRMFGEVVNAIAIVRPATVLHWHRSIWRLLWRVKSRRPVGRPPADADLRVLIRRFWTENPWCPESRRANCRRIAERCAASIDAISSEDLAKTGSSRHVSVRRRAVIASNGTRRPEGRVINGVLDGQPR
jgi:hypothetical protein